ncbi:Acetoin utilization deacetylase AcuC [Lutimaribacter pacificus]|uniref:Acetoin utilization deacetylase AcuC n=1 Tax=Lutimaribacter pacificus TaxID=391948 RepID=A0A1H0IUC0_9RHOB|nr:class II histone deacetylase [Lutimaribacter pacificus]SDO35057.1 Acetoin utilization deacetylase AcuC [Lutimaribacter pacificus]SHK17434.1 Acetoin utilization deacetylase AcuC [Lutimaribacter pacificus]
MTTAFYFDEKCLWHSTGEHALILPVGGYIQPPSAGGHAESPESKRRLKNLMDVSGLTGHLDVKTAEPAVREDMLRVHTESYIDAFRQMSDAGGGNAGIYSPFGAGSFEIAALSAGLARRAVADVLTGVNENGYALSRPPGHHCLPEQSMGFCLLANIPIAIEAARADHGLGKVAILDWDVHHGNGTQAVYYERGDTLTISLHQEGCFPPGQGTVDECGEGAGIGANLNIPLLPGGGHRAYLDAMELLVLPAIRAFGPDMIVIASGFDANAFDPLSRMQAHSGTFREMTRQVMELAEDICGGRVVAVHEGGYAEVVVPFCGLATIEQLSGVRTDVVDPFEEITDGQQSAPDFDLFQRQRLEAQSRWAVG